MAYTKILCTLGPSTDEEGMVLKLAQAGMNAARINFSHGGAEKQLRRILAVREAEKALGRPIGIVADLQGPKIRIGRFKEGVAELKDGDEITLESGDGACDAARLTVDYPGLAQSVIEGGDIYLSDGLLHLKVVEKQGAKVRCRIIRGGRLTDRKGVNLPGVPIDLPSLTEKDRKDALDAVEMGCDMIALSFVRTADDLKDLREHIRGHGGSLPIIVKLERPEAIDNLDAILEQADAVMVARGDLGVEVGVETVPVLQKTILQKARRLNKPAIVATQMLESMTSSPIPTRAEASDVANAILDGADTVMLSGETAAGRYPIESVRMLGAIANNVEPMLNPVGRTGSGASGHSVAEAVVDGVMAMADDLDIKAIVAYTKSGYTAMLLAKRRPPVPIVALVPDERIRRRCTILYGCEPVEVPLIRTTEEIFTTADRLLLERRLAAKGDKIIVVAGYPFGVPGTTNLIHVHLVGLRPET